MHTRSQLLKQLAEIKSQIDHGDRVIEAQERIIGTSVHSRDVAKDRTPLEQFERTQALRHNEIARLLEALD